MSLGTFLAIGSAFLGSKDSGGSSNMPPPRTAQEQFEDAITIALGADAVGKYKDGFTDPKLLKKFADRDFEGRKALSDNDLRIVDRYLEGVEAGGVNPEYKRIQARIKALEEGEASTAGAMSEEELRKKAQELYPVPSKSFRQTRSQAAARARQKALQDDYVERGLKGVSGQNAAEIAELKAELANTSPTQEGIKGMNQMREEQAQLTGDIERSQASQFRDSNVADLERLGGRTVQAYRDADPASRDLAIQASERAGQGQTEVGRLGSELLGGRLGSGEQALLDAGLSSINSPLAAASANEQAVQQRGLMDIFAQREAAGEAEKRLQKMGMSLSDLSPTEQESLILGRGKEFIQSTGELSPLERRNATQDARQGSVARGRAMGMGSLYDEMLARSSEELNKQERQVGLGADLLQQEANMRESRLSQGGGFLSDAENFAAQRRQEEFDRQQAGAASLRNAEVMQQQRVDNQLRNKMFGAETLVAANQAERERQRLGASLFGQDETIQTNRINTAFDMNRDLAPDLGQVLLNTNYNTSAGAQSNINQASGNQGFNVVDPNSSINLAESNYENEISRQGMIADANARASAERSQMFGSLSQTFAGMEF